jgi:hypothetical protein
MAEMQSYAPRSSGLLHGSGGLRGFRRRRAREGRNFPDLMLSATTRIRDEVPDFDPDLADQYTQRELRLLAEKILLTDPKLASEEPAWLNATSYRYRLAHEIYTASGVPDPAIASGMYWRTHPNGRKWATPEVMRATGCGFYDGVQETDREIPPPSEPVERVSAGYCAFPGCENVAGTKGLCAGHRAQYYSGRELVPLSHKISAEQKRAIREATAAGEARASVARRLGVSLTSVDSYRARRKISS